MTRSRTLFYTTIPTDIGTLYVAATDNGVCRLAFDTTEAEFVEELTTRSGGDVIHAPDRLRDVESQVERYFLGELRTFDLTFDFLDGTPFHQRVWRTLLTIPYGQVRSYKWVAEQVGAPLGARAVGQANSRNPVAILIPCHRVINHDGGIGGYGDRLDIKAHLLRLEGATLEV